MVKDVVLGEVGMHQATPLIHRADELQHLAVAPAKKQKQGRQQRGNGDENAIHTSTATRHKNRQNLKKKS